jgi:proteasome lid subunit RPN8/RPN11
MITNFSVKYNELLEDARIEAKAFIANTCTGLEPEDMFSYIWMASTQILPKLEVQVVVDSNDRLHISTGSSGYVDFRTNPVGIKLPIKCWIHTHPFGSAYFSGVDWKTVNTWQPLMLEAYVLGGENHYGHWNNTNAHELRILEKDGSVRVQEQQLRVEGDTAIQEYFKKKEMLAQIVGEEE